MSEVPGDTESPQHGLRTSLVLTMLGLAMAVGYFLYLPIPEHVEADLALLGRSWPPARGAADLAVALLGGAQLGPLGMMSLLGGICAFYLAALAAARGPGTPGLRRLVLGFAALFAATLMLQPSLLSRDLYTYLLDGRIQVLYGGSPYEVVRASMESDPALTIEAAKDLLSLPNPYGPIPVLLSALAVKIAGPDLASEVLAWKALSVLLAVLSVGAFHRIVKRHWPGHRLHALVAITWNPLLLLHLVGDAHNDLVVLWILLLAVEQMLSDRPTVAGALLGLAFMSKSPTLVLAFAYGLFLLRHQPAALVRACVAGACVSLLLLVPYGLPTLSMFRSAMLHSDLYANSFFTLAAYGLGKVLLASGASTGMAGALIHSVIRPALGLLAVGALARRAWSASTPAQVIQAAATAWYGIYLLVTPYYWPWYLALPLTLLYLTPQAPLRTSALCLSLTSLGLVLPLPLQEIPQADKVVRLVLVYAAPVILAALEFARPWTRSPRGA